MKARLISITPDAETTMGYIARVSNPANQDNPKVSGLLKYCIKHNHWSVFEQSFMTLEVTLLLEKLCLWIRQVYTDCQHLRPCVAASLSLLHAQKC